MIVGAPGEHSGVHPSGAAYLYSTSTGGGYLGVSFKPFEMNDSFEMVDDTGALNFRLRALDRQHRALCDRHGRSRQTLQLPPARS